MRWRIFAVILLGVFSSFAATRPSPPATGGAVVVNPWAIENAFQPGQMLVDTNGNGIPDFLDGHVVVPDQPTAAENAAAANLAARLAYGTTGLTMPVVVTTSEAGPGMARFFVGARAMSSSAATALAPLTSLLGTGEGGVFLAGDIDLAVVGSDAPGLLAAADDFASHAPYQWAMPGEKIGAIAQRVNALFSAAKLNADARLVGLTYVDKEPGIRRAILTVSGTASAAAVRKALAAQGKPPLRFAAVQELVLLKSAQPAFGAVRELLRLASAQPPIILMNPVPMALPAEGPMPASAPKPLDLGQLYTIKGLLGGSPKLPIPSAVDTRLYVPAGAPGVAMANLAARIGLETTGISFPLAYVPSGISLAQVPAQGVVTADSGVGKQLVEELTGAKDERGAPYGKEILEPLAAGEGELRSVDDAFGKHAALLVRGDAAGQAAALEYAAGRLPFLWQPDKRYESTDEIRYDLHRFFSLRSSAGQAAAALYHLDRWVGRAEAAKAKPRTIDATVYVDKADPKLASFLQSQIERAAPGAKVSVRTGSLHAGLKCCASDPPLHYVSRRQPFVQAKPTFSDDFTIPWEGGRLVEAVRQAAPEIVRGQPAELRAEVSEGPAERRKLQAQIERILTAAGSDPVRTRVEVLCAYKPGYSWLMDEIAPELKGQPVSRIVLEFRPDIDPEKTSLLYSRARWLQELYPVDEMLSRKLGMPLKNIRFQEMSGRTDRAGPTYRLRAYGAGGRVLLSRGFTVHTAVRPYSSEFPQYDHVQVDTGWVHLVSGGKTLLDRRVETDVEMFWDHYQTITLPRLFHFVMTQNDGKPLPEYQPLFDTLLLHVHLSEPDYGLGWEHQRISSLDALEEDTLYSTENFFYMAGTLDSTGPFDYMGRVIPVVYPSTDGQNGRVTIEFFAKDGPRPLVELKWRDGAGRGHQEERDLPALRMGLPRLVAARVRSGAPGVESLTWQLPADARADRYQDWIRTEPASQVERTMFSVEQAAGQVRALAAMHAAGLFPDSLAYPHLRELGMEFTLPRPLRAPEHSRPSVVAANWAVPPPATARPQIADYTPAPMPASPSGHIVSWNEPISPRQSAEILARLAKFPGVTVYWMGRSYLGANLWAADILSPTPSKLRSLAKLDTFKATIVYSARQHANEVSSTSHVLRLAEELLRDPSTRAALKKVNVVIHPIDNPDGANLSIDLMHITPKFLLHPGYHGALTADVESGVGLVDPVYPESRTRGLLREAWLPDAFLNPHGYPSHEWVQPFSGYTAWMTRRTGVESGYSWWIPRGWFTSLAYRLGPGFSQSKDVAYELRARIARAIDRVPGAAALDAAENELYERYGVDWEPRRFQQPLYDGVRIYMALKGIGGPAAGRGAGYSTSSSPSVTWDEGYTEAPDETAHGAYLHLVAGMGLAYDRVHLNYLAEGKFQIARSEKQFSNGAVWKVSRARPILPSKWLLKPGPGIEAR